jgi:hypothetical protein
MPRACQGFVLSIGEGDGIRIRIKFLTKKLSISSAITGVPGETPLQADYLTTQALLIQTI